MHYRIPMMPWGYLPILSLHRPRVDFFIRPVHDEISHTSISKLVPGDALVGGATCAEAAGAA
jgi:hypothetical protein